MDNIQKIEQLLDRYIEINKKKQEEYDKNKTIIDLYDQLFIYLDKGYDWINENKLVISILFNTIYNNNIYYDEFNLLFIKMSNNRIYEKEYKEFINKIKKEYNQLLYNNQLLIKQKEKNRKIMSSAYTAKFCFKNKRPINERYKDVTNIKTIIDYFEIEGIIDNKEELMLINEIELYNRRLLTNKNNIREQQYYTTLYEKIPNILKAGFQEHDKIQVLENKRSTLDKFAKEIFDYSKNSTSEDTIICIKSYLRYNLSDDEYNYIIVKVLDNYLEELLFLYQYLLEKKVYSDGKERITVVESYYKLLDRYLYLKEYYEKITEVYVDESIEIDNNELLDKTAEKRIIFTHSNTDIAKAKIINDMDGIPYEYYDKISELINGFIYGNLTRNEIKPLNIGYKTSNYFELKNDQIRIIMKHINDNVYCVMGVFAKKSDNLRKEYRNMTSRTTPKVETEERLNLYLQLSDKVLEELDLKIKEKSRKGTR